MSYPLHFRDAELEEVEMEYNPRFLWNILPRIEWEALRVSAGEVGAVFFCWGRKGAGEVWILGGWKRGRGTYRGEEEENWDFHGRARG